MPKTFHFKITLIDSKPPIWRRFKVTDDYRLDRFHQVLQIVMGWENSHLHEFRIKGRNVGMVSDLYESPEGLEDETIFHLKDFELKRKDALHYDYDFGDSWEHLVVLEDISEEQLLSPICTDGAMACPPEDCGGIWHYSKLVEIVQDAAHPDYEEYQDWLPEDFDPGVFPISLINRELKKFGLWHQKNPKAKSTPWHRLN